MASPALITKFLNPMIRLSVSLSIPSRSAFTGKFTWTNLISQNRYYNLRCILNLGGSPQYNCYRRLSRHKLGISSSFVVSSFMIQSLSLSPRHVYATDGHGVLATDTDYFGGCRDEKDGFESLIWIYIRKMWLPVIFVMTLLVNWNHPAVLFTKVVLFLLSTKPSPLSVYIFIHQFCDLYMRRRPHMSIPKPLFAKNVEVQDYKLLCVASVEIGEQKLTLIGILGGWWVLPLSQISFVLG